jgi:hypothetical protein
MKRCPRCKTEKDEKLFSKASAEKCGYQPWCKKCVSDKQTQYTIDNREKRILSIVKNRAKARGIPFDLELEDIVIPEYCPILKVKLTNNSSSRQDVYGPSLDRIVPELGYVKGNVMVMSRKANVMKNNATPEEIRAFCEYFKDKEDGGVRST